VIGRRFVVGVVYAGFSLLAIAADLKIGFLWALVFILSIATAGGLNYLLGWSARDAQIHHPDLIRERMRVTARPVPLEQHHIQALVAYGENSFGPMELDDDHDEALAILREHVAVLDE
jgi:hypothetical protein